LSDGHGRHKHTLIAVDGTSLMYRAYYAIRELTGPDGSATNAVYGFTNMLLRLLDDYDPEFMVVSFDRGKPEHRIKLYPDYKGHRPEMPDDLRSQFAPAREILAGLGIPCLEVDGVEADDVIASVVGKLSSRREKCLIVTGDKDFLQLVDDNVRVLLTRRGITEMTEYDREQVLEDVGLPPERLADMKGLMGDSSDNIPGVPGVGEKTAQKLLRQFSSVEEVLENLDAVPGKKLPQTLCEHADDARMSKKLATIDRDVRVDVSLSDCRTGELDRDRLRKVFGRLGFRRIAERLDLDAREVSSHAPKDAPECEAVDMEDLEDFLIQVPEDGEVVIDFVIEPRGIRGDLRHLFVFDTANGTAHYLCTVDGADAAVMAHQVVSKLLGAANLRVIGCGLRPLFLWSGIHRPKAEIIDLKVLAYLMDPSQSSYTLEALGHRFLNRTVSELSDDIELSAASDRLAALHEMVEVLSGQARTVGVDELFAEIEVPLIPLLASMQDRGIRVDATILRQEGDQLDAEIEEIQGRVWELAGRQFNLNSPKQLGQVLFEELELPVVKKTKTGPSTDSEVLQQLSEEHEIPRLVLDYRHLAKLRGTYVSGLLKVIDEESNRVHTTFKQCVTATGRLSSADPNLQNIPVRDRRGRRLRRAFVAEPGWKLLAADYSQIELRVLAHFSQDERMIEAFRSAEDIHARTASEVFGVGSDAVTPEMRSAAKAVNFGIIYGISGYGLSRSLEIDAEESQKYIDDYLDRMPGVRDYLQRVVQRAKEDGYVRTMMGRIRYLPDLHSSTWHRRRFAERTALNTPIQGTAADIIKKAMVEAATAVREEQLECHMLLQVHDELIWEVPAAEVDRLSELARSTMEQVVSLDVPLKVDLKTGDNWYDMQQLDLR